MARFFISLFTSILLITATASAQSNTQVNCTYWQPHGPSFTSNHVALNFQQADVNMTALNPLRLANTTRPPTTGSVFHIQRCLSPGLNIAGASAGSCTGTGCVYSINEYLRVINPKSTHCLSWAAWDGDSRIAFEPCESTPQSTYQLWNVKQTVTYGAHWAGPPSYSVPQIFPVGPSEKGPQFNMDSDFIHVLATVTPDYPYLVDMVLLPA